MPHGSDLLRDDPRGHLMATDPRSTSTANIVICDELSPAAMAIFERRGHTVLVRTGLDEAGLITLAPEASAFVVRSATRITRRVIEAAPNLRVVGRAGVGVDNVDHIAATERGVVVMNTPTGNTTTTAELAVALMCSLARHVPRAARLAREGGWSKKGLVGTELTGKTLGVVGFGRIGRVVAERALGLRMRVLCSDPFLPVEEAEKLVPGVRAVQLDELVAESDFVTLHVPLDDSTRGLFGEERLARMKPGARLINAARGGLVDETALCAALESGHLAGAALDVLEQEPPPADHPLLRRDDVIVTPHLGASSVEAQHAVAVGIAEQICDFLETGVAHNAVNAPAVPVKTLREIAPYVVLAEKIGDFIAQLCSDPLRKLEITLAGEIASKDHRHIPLALLVGALRRLEPGVNFVNAPTIAKERGLRVLESVDEDGANYVSLLKVRASTRGGEESHVVAGTVFGRKPLLVRIDDQHLDLAPEGTMLITRHQDRPGVVGRLGTILGNHGVNIRGVVLGPAGTAADGLASAYISLYAEPTPEAIEEIRALDNVRAVRLVQWTRSQS